MSYKNSTIYPSGIETPDSDFPEGKPKDATSDTSTDGWPYDQRKQSDIEALLQSLLVRNGVTPNGAGDTVLASQYVDSLFNLTGKVFALPGDLNNINSLRAGELVRVMGLNSPNDGISRLYRIANSSGVPDPAPNDLILTGDSAAYVAVFIGETSGKPQLLDLELTPNWTAQSPCKVMLKDNVLTFSGSAVFNQVESDTLTIGSLPVGFEIEGYVDGTPDGAEGLFVSKSASGGAIVAQLAEILIAGTGRALFRLNSFPANGDTVFFHGLTVIKDVT